MNRLFASSVARSVPFDSSSNSFSASDVQAAIEEARAFSPQTTSAVLFDDFNNAMTWSPSTTGASSVASVSGGNATLASGKHLGVAQVSCGTVLPSTAALVQSGALSDSTVFGNGSAEYQTLIRINQLATVAEDFTFRCGFGTSNSADHADGIYFEYNRATSTNWLLKTASNSVRTTTTSSIAVAASTWTHLRWVVNSAGTQVDFYVNGTSAGSNTTNIPTTTGRGSGPNFQITAVAGTSTARAVYIDYFYFLKNFTARD